MFALLQDVGEELQTVLKNHFHYQHQCFVRKIVKFEHFPSKQHMIEVAFRASSVLCIPAIEMKK